ncbi:MAG: DMT family transporter, partial [Streptosporangiaceae bacterium]
MAMVSVLLAVLAAAANAAASVLQRKATRREPDRKALSLSMIVDLLPQPVWFAGILAILVGFLLQVSALATGRLSEVQPLLVMELPFTLVLSSLVFRSRPHAREWLSAGGMAVGLALFLIGLAPSSGEPLAAPVWAWAAALVVTLAAICLVVWLG